VTDSYVSIYRSGPTVFVYERPEASFTVLTVEGNIDPPVVRMETVAISVRRREHVQGDTGGAHGISSIWQLIVFLPEPEFSDLRAIILSGKLRRARLLMESVKRGKGTVKSINFHTRGDDEEER
jgi:hypothetical protein